jgi:tetratricopeptide (TPR) repeat protein
VLVCVALACALHAPLVPQDQSHGPLAVGAKVPPLQCRDIADTALSWNAFERKAVLLFFHSEAMAFSQRGLESIAEAVAAEPGLAGHAVLLLVTSGRRDLDLLEKQLAVSGLPGRIVVDPDRRAFAAYRVVAFPTVFVVGGDLTIAHIAKGFGPLLASKVIAGLKLGAGLIDRAAFEDAVKPAEHAVVDQESLRIARTVRMAKQLLAAGLLQEARDSLERVLGPDTREAEAISLLAQVIVLQKRPAEAQVWIDRLTKLDSPSHDVHQLLAEVHLQRDDPDAALKAIEGLDDRAPRVALLKGRALEKKGAFEAAAAAYRRALERLAEGEGR